MNRKPTPDQQSLYRMNYYPGALAPGGYAIAASDKPGLYAASPYAAMASPYATAQTLPPGMAPYPAAARQQYAVVSQASPYTTQPAAAAYYATASATGYPAAAGVPLSSLQTMSSSAQQSAYLGAQYAAGMGVQRAAMMGPTSVAAAGYNGSPLYASSYTGLPAVPGQPSRSPYGVAPVGYATPGLPPSPSTPGGYTYGLPY